MLKKILLPISALAAMSLMACSGSAKVQVQTDSAPASEPAVDANGNAISGTDGVHTGAMTDEEIAAAMAAQQAALAAQANGSSQGRGLLSNGGPDQPMPASCEITVDNASELQLKIDVKDIALVTMNIAVVDNTIKSVLSAAFKENVSQEEIANECELTKNENADGAATVVCEGNTITATETISDMPVEMFGMAANMTKDICIKTQQSGFIGGTSAAPSASAAPAEGLKIDCNVDMNSNEWTVNVNGINMKYVFEGNTVKQITEIAQDVGSPEMCQMAVNAAKQEDSSADIRCEGSVMKMQAAEIMDDTTKEELYQNMKPLCPSK